MSGETRGVVECFSPLLCVFINTQTLGKVFFVKKRFQNANLIFDLSLIIMSFHDYMRCKCKRKRKWKCKGVHTSNANAKKERYGRAVEVFFQDGRQRSSFCRLTSVGSIALTLAFAFALALGWFTCAILYICICVCCGSYCVID